MQFHIKPLRPNQMFLKEGEGGSMRMKREGEEEEVWWDWDKTYNLKLKIVCKKLKHIYCKYLHGE